ncbi:MAG: UDP-3-O-(3-hydroxymyristoyl)glucosamine N-acyltransferase, partial [Armatimonadota bacterium]|nr:UDP-3-O-(3-hydroxymyristoyl)glucosamine N-acyltransferase [Armatimonadota bacterium]
MAHTLEEIAALVGGVVEGDPQTAIDGAAGLEDAAPGDIIFVEDARYAPRAIGGAASAVIAPPGLPIEGKPVVRVAHPRAAFLRVLELLQEAEPLPTGIAPTARIGKGAEIGAGAAVGDYCCLGEHVVLGAGVVLFPFVYLGDHVTVGPGSVLYPHVTVYRNVEIGARVRIHAGAVIGADGFGYLPMEGEHRKIPHLGRVVIEDDVEIGACTCVDRAKTAETRIGRGTKIDNLVQIAHNVVIGENSVLAAMVGISGSTKLGKGVIVGGQTGMVGHINIG